MREWRKIRVWLVLIGICGCLMACQPDTAGNDTGRNSSPLRGMVVSAQQEPSVTASATPLPPSATPTATITPTQQPSHTPTTTAPPTTTPFDGVIPTRANQSQTAAAVTVTEHIIQSGDTLTTIANRYGITVDQLLAVNDRARWQVLYVGEIIRIPLDVESTTSVALATQPAQITAISNAREGIEHTVTRGDTLTNIARRYGVMVDQILLANDMSRSEVLLPGRRLIIPNASNLPAAPSEAASDAVASAGSAGILPTPFSGMVNDLRIRDYLIMPDDVEENVRQIFARGQELGRNPRAFTRIGDSTIEAPHFFYRFDSPDYNLGDFYYLQRTIDYYAGSFAHDSVAVIRGLHSWSVFDSMWAPRDCDNGEHMLACEFRRHNPSIIFIRLGSNDQGDPQLLRENFEEIVQYCIDNGVIPVIGTKADRFDSVRNTLNQNLREIADLYDVPLWDFDRVASTIAGRGLMPDNVHLTIFYPHDWRQPRAFRTGHGLHNLTGLIVLDEIRKVVVND